MKCNEIVKWIADPKDCDSFPKEVRQHIANCAECRQLLEDNRFVAQMVSLKRFEQPVVGTEERIAENIRTKLALTGKNDLGRFMWSDLQYFTKPAFQIAVASIFIVLIGSFFFKDAVSIDSNPQVSEIAPHEMPYAQPDWMAAQTNPVPNQIQYGSGPSRMVDFELDQE